LYHKNKMSIRMMVDLLNHCGAGQFVGAGEGNQLNVFHTTKSS